MHVSEVRLQLSRRITVKNARGDYDSTEVQVSVTGSLTPEDNAEQELVNLSGVAHVHIVKEFELAVSEKSQAVVDLIQQKGAVAAAATPEPAVEPQRFTQKPRPAAPMVPAQLGPYLCISGCGRSTKEPNRRCSPCLVDWNNRGRPHEPRRA